MKIGFGQFVLLWLLSLLLGGAACGANWAAYSDTFDTDKGKDDSCIQSRFWLDRATPPPGPYLFYFFGDNGSRQLGFMGYQNQLAELGYCLTLDSFGVPKAVRGSLTVEVSYPDNMSIAQDPLGQLVYSTSGDGVSWSQPQWLAAGWHQIPIDAPSGTAYVRFSGTHVAIDNLQTSLSTPPTTTSISGGFSSIQAAINAAAPGAVIEIGPGTYPGNIQFRGKAITLRSTSGPQQTIIDAGGSRGFYFHEGEGADTVLSGFTIRNARAPGATGGGIYCEFSSPTITNCIIQNCSAAVGGGIGALGAAPAIIDCAITDCSATYGGAIGLTGVSNATIARSEITGNFATYGAGIYCQDSLALIGDCRISGNGSSATTNGGGAFCTGTLTDATFKNCLLFANSAAVGAGVAFQGGAATVTQCTIANNQAQQAGGLYSTGTDFFMTNSIVWGNGTNPVIVINPALGALTYPITFSDIQGGGHLGEGNLNEDPLFANPAAGDYHLLSRHGRYDPQRGWVYSDWQDSPCIDAGDRGSSAAAEPGPNGERVNMGAYGAGPQASKSVEHTIWHVDTHGGKDAYGRGLSRAQAFKTIAYALAKAQYGDTILVWPGVYREELVFESKAVTVRSAADAAILEAADWTAVSFYYAESSRSTLANFVIRNCRGSAIFCSGASPTLKNLTIVGNQFGIEAYDGADPYIVNCIIWGNADGSLAQCTAYFSNVERDPTANPKAARNISVDPLFVNTATGDYHLQSQYGRYDPQRDEWVNDDPKTSPCIDAGNPQDYYEAEFEPNGDVINMGAYGGTPYASKSSF
ncbi:MAG: right-handed parallel beta-helix repeat-containing protein [Sedimentisphaerales bacterium]|nr:right-handed parallel beta-helix repeat-containing protein [Sedimentisphaerales bacterium]